MSQAPRSSSYTEYHPRWYRKRVSTWWWTTRWSYFKFILREISSVFVAWFIVELLMLIYSMSSRPGPFSQQAYWEFEGFLRNPVVEFLNIVSLFFVIFHAITWFNLAASAMVVRMGGKRVPGILIAAGNYMAWVVVTAVIALFLVKA
jgi:fumarate reductase subunit C